MQNCRLSEIGERYRTVRKALPAVQFTLKNTHMSATGLRRVSSGGNC